MRKIAIPVMFALGVVAWWWLAPPWGVCDGTDAELLPIVEAGTKNACSLIRSGRGDVVIHTYRWPSAGRTFETETTYSLVFSNERYRVVREIRYLENSGVDEEVARLIPAGSVIRDEVAFDGAKVTQYTKNRHRAIIGEPSSAKVEAAHSDYLINVSVPKFAFVDVSRMNSPRIAGREVVDGSECVVVESERAVSLPNGTASRMLSRVWVDPQRGFLIPRVRVYAEDAAGERILCDEMTTELHCYAGDIWGPVKQTREAYRKKKDGTFGLERRTVKTYDPSFQLNVPISDNDLSVRLPSGTKVHDETTDAMYTVP